MTLVNLTFPPRCTGSLSARRSRSRCCSPPPPSSPPVIHRWSCLLVFFYVYPDDDTLAGSFSGSPLLYTPLVTLTSNVRLGALALSLFIACARAVARRGHPLRLPLFIDGAVLLSSSMYILMMIGSRVSSALSLGHPFFTPP